MNKVENKTCDYCNKNKSFEEEANKQLIQKSLKNEIDVGLEIDRGKLVLWVDNLTYYDNGNLSQSDDLTSKKINYCPMCGRRLDGKE